MKNCPFCDSGKARCNFSHALDGWWVYCPECKSSGPTGATMEQAIKLWDNGLPRLRKWWFR